MKQKSAIKQKKEGTHEFFPRSKAKGTDFTFNKAPLNKSEAFTDKKLKYQEETEKRKEQKKSNPNQKSFLQKMYQDEDDLDDLRVMGGLDEDDAELKEAREDKDNQMVQQAKRKTKANEKDVLSKYLTKAARINKLSLNRGTVGLFAICEVTEDRLIVNHTRNTKGYISLKSSHNSKQFKVGQYVVASVLDENGGRKKTTGKLNRKRQLTLDPHVINKTLAIDTATKGMFLQVVVEATEQKGYTLDLGFKDNSKGFVKFEDCKKLQKGDVIQVLITKVMQGSKVVKCEQINQTNCQECVQQQVPSSGKDVAIEADGQLVTLSHLKPGFVVSAKVSKIYENGVEITYLGGLTATCFIDHLPQNVSNYKIGQKMLARLISTDPLAKRTTASLLPSIVEWKPMLSVSPDFAVGRIFESAKVKEQIFGGSYRVTLPNCTQIAFLHKAHSNQQEGDEENKAMNQEEQELKVGDTIENLKIKEFNYFDQMPMLSMKQSIVEGSGVDYNSMKVGDVVKAKIQSVNSDHGIVTLAVNDFIKGTLSIEQMGGDTLYKHLPSKFQEPGKDIKVRIFNVEPSKQCLEFTKKDGLLKDDVPIYQSIREVRQGTKLVSLIVAKNEHGYITKTFGGIKGLLTFEDAGESHKVGQIIKAYVLFKKKDKGVALTVSKKKAREERDDGKQETSADSLDQQIPNEEEVAKLFSSDKYSTTSKASQDESLVGTVRQFRLLEGDESSSYLVLKSIDAEKKSKNIIAVAPKSLLGNFQDVCPLKLSDSVNMKGLVFRMLESGQNKIPVVALHHELMSLKDQVQPSKDDFNAGSTFVGVVSSTSDAKLKVAFLNGVTKSVKVKDLNRVDDWQKVYKIGQVIRVAVNKVDRLCTKEKVLMACGQSQKDKEVQISALCEQYVTSSLIGDVVETEVQLVKDYGVIVKILDQEEVTTGFIINAQLASKKIKPGQKMRCRVLDVDPVKKMADLSEKLGEVKTSKRDVKVGEEFKGVVELNKESFVIVSLKSDKSKIGFCILQNFNRDDIDDKNPQIGDELEVKVTGKRNGVIEFIPTPKKDKKPNQEIELKEGTKFTGQVKSIKNQCMYIKLPVAEKQASIGRLHQMECQSLTEFHSYSVGDRIEAKILQISKPSMSGGRTFVELTRALKHMQKLDGLDPDTPIITEADLKADQKYRATIVAINFKYSEPIQVQLSPFVRGSIPFDHMIDPSDLSAAFMENKYSVGQQVDVKYLSNNHFSLLKNAGKQNRKRGDLVTVRYVNSVKGKGMTVQIDSKTYGFLEMCEVTDQFVGNVFSYVQNKNIFVARIIDTDKNGKLQVSSRESIVDESLWKNTRPEGTTVKFQEQDEQNAQNANQRNKIVKFGPNIALQRGDVAVGYVANVSKAGCFVQIGHNCVVRAGLNQLSDSNSFNFETEMPQGRLVVGRITKVTEQPKGDKRFDFSLRKSLVVHGVGVIDRSKLEVDMEVEAIVMAVAEGKAFAQIKGSYHQIKVKGYSHKIEVGDHVMAKLKKVTKEKISSLFVKKMPKSALAPEELRYKNILASVEQEANKELDSVQSHFKQDPKKGKSDFDLQHIDQANFMNTEEQVAAHIRDLNELQQQDDEDEQMEVDSDDSDAELMKKLIYEDKSDEEEGEDEQMQDEDEEEGESEAEDDDSESQEEEQDDIDADSSDEETDARLSKKRTLKQRIKEEQDIRAKERRMRDETDQPKNIDDFERLLVANKDQSYLWIQYMAFMLDNVGIDAARKVAERGVKGIGMANEQDKLNLWTAFMNLESNFGTQQSLEDCTRRGLEVNDRKKIYLNLIDIYKSSMKFQYIELIYKQLTKKYSNALDVWSNYLEFLIEMNQKKQEGEQKLVLQDIKFSEPKQILAKSLQALSKDQHVNMISKYGMLEFKHGNPENGRTMFEGIVSNYPKRMDIWAIYMDMESKHGQGNVTQARHLFERCLNNEHIIKKPKKMKLVFQKYMEYENKMGNKSNLAKLRERVEEYLMKAYPAENKDEEDKEDSEMESE